MATRRNPYEDESVVLARKMLEDYAPYEDDEATKEALRLASEHGATKANTYDQYTGKVNQYASDIKNRKPFVYDMNGDALYQQYKDQYINQGKLAMQDTMGKASALTGGYGNSYAASVGNQAYQGYLQQLNNVVPDLYNLAYNKYNQEGNEMRNNMSMYQALADQWQSDQSALDTRASQLQSQGYGNWSAGYDSLLGAYNTAVKNAESAADKDYDDQLAQEKLIYDQINKANELALKENELALKYAKEGYAVDSKTGSVVKTSGSGSGSSEKLKNPTSSMFDKALKAYNEGGESALDKYVATIPGYDSDQIFEYISQYGELPLAQRTYTKVKDTWNDIFNLGSWWGGVDHNDVVKDQYGNEYKIDDLPTEIQMALTKLKEGEEWSPNKKKTTTGKATTNAGGNRYTM